MFGDNPKRPFVKSSGEILDVKSIFKTIQGEGPFVGVPAVFIRLGGCNLACTFCDTDFENYNTLSVDEIVSTVLSLASNTIKLIVITGGEPLRQPISLLCEKLLQCDLKIQIETNGSLYRELPSQVFVVCSPKAFTKSGYQPLQAGMIKTIHAMKFLISKNLKHYDSIPELGQTQYKIPVFLQPMDENDAQLNKINIDFTVQLALKTGSTFSLQMHKVIGIL